MWMQENQILVKSTDEWNRHWQLNTNHAVSVLRLIIPVECFNHARNNTFHVNYKDMLVSTNSEAFNKLLRTEAMLCLLDGTCIHDDKKPMWVTAKPHPQVYYYAVIVRSARVPRGKSVRICYQRR
jgi:hypothetical protein